MHKTISSLQANEAGKVCEIKAKIEEVQQTSGPTLFTLFDGTGSLVVKAFAGAGVRAFPQLKEGNIVKAVVKLIVYEDALEGEIQKISLLGGEEAKKLAEQIEQSLQKQAEPQKVAFLIKSDVLERLRPRFLAFATAVRKAIMESRPIILRHNADTDGYTAALALEQAIVPLIIAHHADEKAQWHYYKRSPSRAPSYEYVDALKDLATTLQDMARFGMKEPLIILADFGGTRDDLLSLQKVRAYGAKVLLVDHHYPGEEENGKTLLEKYSDVLVNPHCVGGDSNICTGMLATELAHIINPKCQFFLFAAVAVFGDKVKGNECDQYVEKAENLGYTKEFLQQIAECIDFDAQYLRFIESRGLMSDLLLSKKERQKELVDMLFAEITVRRNAVLEATKHYVVKTDYPAFLFGMLNISATTVPGEYPAAGKATGLLFDYLKKIQQKPVIVFGYGGDFITIRSSYNQFDVNAFVKELQQKFLYALVSGGGHEVAGSVRFVEAAQKEILEYCKKWMGEKGK